MLLLAAIGLIGRLFAAEAVVPAVVPEPQHLTVHEWGTFTSVAGDDGRPMKWAPLSGPGDLPCFVARLTPFQSPKNMPGFVRMETPVLYFYSRRPLTLSVRVQFPEGWVTEWYPQASRISPARGALPVVERYGKGEIVWDSVQVMPGENPKFAATKIPNHYYAARNTDSAPLRVGDEWEKMLFYRGIGDFEVPFHPAFTRAARLRMHIDGNHSLPLAILFENRRGSMGYRVARDVQEGRELDLPELGMTVETLYQELADRLVEFGLYRKEALAMIETWRQSWFEEGTRLFYIVPRPLVDALLPLTVTPAPAATARVFVGRIELLSPAVRQEIETALRVPDVRGLAKFGRFLEPFLIQMGGHLPEGGGSHFPPQGNRSCIE